MTQRKRLPSEESRLAALDAARTLLIETGPQSVTLKAVATRIGRTHANLLHHFGSAAGLQKSLAEHLAKSVCATIADTIRATRRGTATPRDVVDLTFDAFGRDGGGALASWMLLSGNEDALDPIVSAIDAVVDELHPEDREPEAQRNMRETTLTLVLMALGDALLGDQLAASLQVGRSTARERATQMMSASLIRAGENGQ